VKHPRSVRRTVRWKTQVPSVLAVSGFTILVIATGACVQTNLLRVSPAVYEDLSIQIVVENPAGTSEKWEVLADGVLTQERVDGAPVTIAYLPWPVNGGMVPRTLHSQALGGDGEPLDVLVLGRARARGERIRVVPIGLLRVIDRLERDDKILAVVPGDVFGELQDVDELEALYPGVREILADWYARSRPGGGIEVQGFGSRAAAQMLIADCVVSFEDAIENQTLPEWKRW